MTKAGVEFTRRKLEWQEAIARDPDISHAACRIALVIGTFLNRKTGDAFPSQETLASILRTHARSVRRLIEQLERAGYLTKSEGGGRGHSNRYRPSLPSSKTGTSASGFVNGTATENGDIVSPIGGNKPGHPWQETGTFGAPKRGHGGPTNLLNEPSENHLRGQPRSKRTRIPESWPSQKDIEWAIDYWTENGRLDLVGSVQHHAAKCRNHHIGKGTLAANWPATWRTWAIREIERPPPQQPHRTGAASAVRGIFLGTDE
jgi:hypothetical protein